VLNEETLWIFSNKMLTNEENTVGRTVQPIYIVVEKSKSTKSIQESYKSKAARIIGILHIICGVVALGMGIALTERSSRSYYSGIGMIGSGIWSSVFFFISGGLSIGSARNGNKCLVISTMVMSIFSAITAGILVIISGVGWGTFYCYNNNDCTRKDVMNAVLVMVGITELILAITSSVISCKATCCCSCCRSMLDTSSSSTNRVLYRPSGIHMDHQEIVSLALQSGQTDRAQDLGTAGLPRYEEVAGAEKVEGFGYTKFDC